MQKLLTKIAPLGVMTACVIWCCWSQLRESTPLLAATEAKLPRIDRTLLHPDLSPPSERDPFLQPKPAPPPATENVEAQIEVEDEPRFDPWTLLPSIRLDATMPGARPMAVINGKILSLGESLVLESETDIPCRLQRVLADGIVMQIEQQTFLIGYSNTPKEIAEPAAKAKTAPPDSAGTEHELPAGIPNVDELESAVADALANQPQPAGGQDNLKSDSSDDGPTHTADEACEFEKDLLNTNKFKELLNNYDE